MLTSNILLLAFLLSALALASSHRHQSPRPIFIYDGHGSISSDDDETDYWQSGSSIYSYDVSGSLYDSLYDDNDGSSVSLEHSVISTLQQALQQEGRRAGTQRMSRKERREKEIAMFKEYVRGHSRPSKKEAEQRRSNETRRSNEPKRESRRSAEPRRSTARMPTREQTVRIQAPPRNTAPGEARRQSILRRSTPVQQQPQTLNWSYHEGSSSDSHHNTSSDRSYTIEFSSSHHRRFRRHFSRSANRAAEPVAPLVLQQDQH